MSEYKRLTSYMQIGDKIVAIQPQRKERIQAYIDRLFELEDKMESGLLLELPCIAYNVKECRYQIISTKNGRIYASKLYRNRKEAEARLKELQEGKK